MYPTERRRWIPVLWAACLAGLGGSAWAGASKPQKRPEMVLGESAPRWVIDRFAGNSTAGPEFLQGPARQAGGLGKPAVAPAPDGSVFLGIGTAKWSKDKIVRVSPDGTLRLLAGGGWSLKDGPAWRAKVAVGVDGGALVVNPADKSVYFVHPSIPALRRLYQKQGHWYIETVAGNPNQTGYKDGPARAALFSEPRNMAITSQGTVYLLDGVRFIRKIERGRVSTLVKFKGGNKLVDGLLVQATLSITKMSGRICLGDNDNEIYVADHWHFAARKIDLRTMTIATVAGMPKPKEWRRAKQTPRERRYNSNSDGSALTHASFNSGCAFVCWDRVHKALWVGGPDETRLRWLKDGWVKTVLPTKLGGNWRSQDALGISPSDAHFSWVHVRAVDDKGRAYIMNGLTPTGIWRAYEKGGSAQ